MVLIHFHRNNQLKRKRSISTFLWTSSTYEKQIIINKNKTFLRHLVFLLFTNLTFNRAYFLIMDNWIFCWIKKAEKKRRRERNEIQYLWFYYFCDDFALMTFVLLFLIHHGLGALTAVARHVASFFKKSVGGEGQTQPKNKKSWRAKKK